MKKIVFIIVALSCMLSLSAFDFMDISGDVGIGYMNHNMVTRYKRDSLKTNLAEGLAAALGADGNLRLEDPKAVDSYNALALGLNLKMSYVYANISVGLPFTQIPTGDDPLAKKLKELGATNKLKNSVIVDGQIGVGINVLKSLPVNIFVGGGLGVNYIQTRRDLPDEFVKTIKDKHGNLVAKELNETRSVAMAGLGINVALSYYFTKNIGVSFDIKDTVHFIPLSNKRYYKGKTIDGSNFTYTITKDDKQDIKSLIKYSWANNLTLRLAVAFKL